MQKKKNNDLSNLKGMFYSTDPNYVPPGYEPEKEEETLPPSQQKLRIWLETKHRGGKAATVISGFTGLEADLNELAKKLKNLCATGGSAKDGEIIIQGDHRDKILTWLQNNGYKQCKKAGG